MDYQQALDYLNSRVMFGIKLGLGNMALILQALGNPHKKLQFIHLAGTNGKGSTGCLLNAGLMSAGRVGFYSSPHLIDTRERFRIDGVAVDKAEFTQAVRTLLIAVESLGDAVEPTFFEVTTLLAILIFRAQECDFVVWETGMGGRLDSTNVVKPLVSIITNVGLDHTGFLGESLEAVAHEKCGIIKSGVPVFYGGDCEVVTQAVLNKAAAENSPLHMLSRDFKISSCRITSDGMETQVEVQGKAYTVKTSLWGVHQAKNVALATAVLDFLANNQKRFDVDKALCFLSKAIWPGRLDRVILDDGAELLVDGAHNVDAVRALVSSLKLKWPGKKWNVCLGILRDKAFVEFIEIINPIVKHYAILPVKNERSLSVDEIISVVKTVCGNTSIKVTDSRQLVAELTGDDNLLTGSLYLIGEVLNEVYRGDLPPIIK